MSLWHAGCEFDYIFDWTILKYQQAQKSKPQTRVSALYMQSFCFVNLSCTLTINLLSYIQVTILFLEIVVVLLLVIFHSTVLLLI